MADDDEPTCTADVKLVSQSETCPCAICKQPATLQCGECQGLPSHDDFYQHNLHYCSETCQNTHLPQHEAACLTARERRAIYRIGEILEPLFFACAELIWQEPIKSVTAEEESLFVDARATWPGESHYEVVFGPVPDTSIVPADLKKAILSYRECATFLGSYWAVINFLTKDIAIGIEELSVWINSPRRPIRWQSDGGIQNGGLMRHEILRLKIKPDTYFIIDITAAQYGYEETITTWSRFVEQRAPDVEEVQRFGHWRDLLSRPSDKTTMKVANALDETMWRTFEKLAVDHGLLNALLESPKHEFDSQSNLIVGMVIDAIKDCFEDFHEPGGLLVRREGLSVVNEHRVDPCRHVASQG